MVFIIDGSHFTMRTHGGNQVFRFVKGIWLHRKSHQIRFFSKRPSLHHTCKTWNEQPSYIKTMPKIVFFCFNFGLKLNNTALDRKYRIQNMSEGLWNISFNITLNVDFLYEIIAAVFYFIMSFFCLSVGCPSFWLFILYVQEVVTLQKNI